MVVVEVISLPRTTEEIAGSEIIPCTPVLNRAWCCEFHILRMLRAMPPSPMTSSVCLINLRNFVFECVTWPEEVTTQTASGSAFRMHDSFITMS